MSPVPRSCSRPRRQRNSHRNFLRRSYLALGLGLLALLAYTLLHSNVSANGNNTVNYSQKSQATFHPATKAHAAPEFVPGEMLVRYRSEAVASREEAAAAPLRVIDGQIPLSVERFNGSDIVEGLRLAHVQSDKTLTAIEAMKANPDVLYAEPNYIVYENATPNDPAYSQMWGLKNTGQSDLATGQPGLPGADIDAELAWNTTTGSSNVVVGVIDTGVDISHPDLAANIWVNPGEIANNNIDDDGNGFIDDINGWDFAHNDKTVYDGGANDPDDHGTHTSGTIGARGNNGVGVTGINWNVKIMPLKFLSGPNGNGSTANAVAAISYAIAMRNRGVNLRVLSNSWGGPGFSQSLLNAVQAANNAGILFVAAAGNETANNDQIASYPANLDVSNVISVAASTRFETLADFSNYGANTVHLAAPGEQVLSTFPNNRYVFADGTSMATPHVSGVAALICAANPGISLQQLRGALIYSGDDIPALATRTISGRRLNANLALQSATENDTTPPGTITDLHVVSQSGRSVTLGWTATGDDGNTGTASLYNFSFTDATLGTPIALTKSRPGPAGSAQTITLNVPYRHPNGTIRLRTFDNLGNEGPLATVAVSADPSSIDPYTINESGASALSTGGSTLPVSGDDAFLLNYPLPFAFPFYGQQRTTLTVSTNGVLYFSSAVSHDAFSSISGLNSQPMIAGMWDDLIASTIFVVQPDSNRIIFRWTGGTFANPNAPINFEIELRRDGTIVTRYGSGNTGLFPVVGISAGEPDAYVVTSHTSEQSQINLTNAGTVTFTPRATAAPTVQLSQASYTVSESSAFAVINVTRTGDTSTAATVKYSTSDATDVNFQCNPSTPGQATGAASRKCDYHIAVGRLRFAPGETTKPIILSIVNDAYVEGSENLTISLSNPTGASLGTPSTATVTITDNDSGGSANPIDGTAFYVRQLYVDLLSREPDPAGQQGWINRIDLCGQPGQAPPPCDRVTVGGDGFLRSAEFFDRQLFVIRLYRSGLGRIPRYDDVGDLAYVSGFLTDADLELNKQELVAEIMSRSEFGNLYNGLGNGPFVDALIATAAVSIPQSVRDGWVTALNNSTKTRAQVYRELSERQEVSDRYLHEAQVVSCYYGFFTRNPDGAYLNFLSRLDSGEINLGDLANAFINAAEYRQRFGQ